MKIINQTNIEVSRLLELLAHGYPVSNLEAHIVPPIPEKPLINGTYEGGNPPVIKVYMRDQNKIEYKPTNEHITIPHPLQYIAYIFLHELFHYMARQKQISYNKEQEEPMADQYAMNRLKEIGINLSENEKSNQANNQLERIMQHVPEQTVSGDGINIIPVDQYVDRNSIGYAYRNIKKVEANGAITQTRNFFLKRFDCGHYCTSIKNFGLDCTNPIKGSTMFDKGPAYHIVCTRCAIQNGCHKCGIPGCRLCFTKHDGQWYCQDCIREITGGWLWALLRG